MASDTPGFRGRNVTFVGQGASEGEMKSHVFLLALLLALAGASFCLLPAQTDEQGGAGARLSFLSDADKTHLLKDRHDVLESHPDLKAEQESLVKQWQALKDQGSSASPEDRRALRQSFMAHSQKMQAAMLKDDPSIAPVLAQVDAKMKERFKDHAATGAGDSGT
jgi:hypothetical protein